MHKRVLAGEGLELVGGSDEGITSLLSKVLGNLLCETDVGVKPGSNRSTTLGNLINIFKGLSYALKIVLKHVHVAGEFLSKGDGCGVLGVGPTNLNDVRKLVTLGRKSIDKSVQLGD